MARERDRAPQIRTTGSMGVGQFVYIDKMFSRRFVDSIINKRNTPTPCRDLSPPPLGGVYPPCTTPHYQIPPLGVYKDTHPLELMEIKMGRGLWL